jgi:HlyD family secretion protein
MTKPVARKRPWVRRGVPVLAVVLAAGGVFGTRAFASGNSDPAYRLGTVAKGSVDQTLTLSGTVRKASQATSSFPVSGSVKSVPVAIGDQVSAGQTLATLDPTTLEAAVIAAEATLAQAKATLAADESSSSAATVGYDTFTTTSAEVFAINTALVVTGGPPRTPAEAAAAVKKAQAAEGAAQTAADQALAALKVAQDAQTTACQTVLAGTATATELADCVKAVQATTAAQSAVATAQTALTKAQAGLATALAAQAKILASSAGSGSGSGSGSSGGSGTGSGSGSGGGANQGGSGSSAQRVASDKAAVTSAETALATAQSDLSKATLTAPISGTVAALSLVAGSASGSNSVTIVGAGAVDVTVDVPLASLPKVKVGQAATVTSVGSSTPAVGTVRSIGLLPASSTSSSVSYPVVVRVPKPTAALASGSTATATITLDTVTGVLTVPNSAVTTLVAGTGFVQTVKAGQATRTLVRTGAVGATRTQILSGLTAGQMVVIADLSAALPTNSTPNRFGNRSGSGLTSSLSGGGAGFGGPGFVTGGGGVARPPG